MYSNILVSDNEIYGLLYSVYVDAGFTTEEVAKSAFSPVAVKNRGAMFTSREISKNEFSGMVIVAPLGSSSIVRASKNECEIHLLRVNSKFRRYELGRKLVSKALFFVEKNGWSKNNSLDPKTNERSSEII